MIVKYRGRMRQTFYIYILLKLIWQCLSIRLLSISYFSLRIQQFILLCTLETFQDRNDKPSKLRTSIKSTHVKCSHRQLMHHANPFWAAVGLAVSIRMSGNKKDWPKRDPTCTLIHSHCHSVDLAILFFISTHYIKVWIEFLSGNYSFEDHFCFITLQVNYSVSPIYGRRRLYTTVCLDKPHHTLGHLAIFGEHQIIGQ